MSLKSKKDNFNFDVVDPRNIFYSNENVYNLKNKNWIIVRFDTTFESLKRDKDSMGYINLDKIEEVRLDGETETKRETADFDLRGNTKKEPEKTPVKDLMVLERHGLDYVIVKSRDEEGNPVEIGFGYDHDGDVLKKAELVMLIKSVAYLNGDTGKRVLIRHQVNPFRDSKGRSYIPLARGLGFIHPTDDKGFGDGVGSRDIQTATNDIFNAGVDDYLIGMINIIKYNVDTVDDQLPLRIENEEMWGHHGNKDDIDVVDLKSNSNQASTLNQLSFLKDAMNTTNARQPGVPIPTSATATSVARADKQVNIRSNYKGLVFDNTCLTNLYWFIIQMSNQFMRPETALEVLGEEHALAFNADLDYIYKPKSQKHLIQKRLKNAKIDKLNTIVWIYMTTSSAV